MSYTTRKFERARGAKKFKRKIYLSTGQFLCYQVINSNGIPIAIREEHRNIK